MSLRCLKRHPSLRIELSVASGDPDLYVDSSNPPPMNVAEFGDVGPYATCASCNNPGVDELCMLTNPAPMTIRINAWDSFAGASLRATLGERVPLAPVITTITPSDTALSIAFEAGSVTDSVSNFVASCEVINCDVNARLAARRRHRPVVLTVVRRIRR